MAHRATKTERKALKKKIRACPVYPDSLFVHEDQLKTDNDEDLICMSAAVSLSDIEDTGDDLGSTQESATWIAEYKLVSVKKYVKGIQEVK